MLLSHDLSATLDSVVPSTLKAAAPAAVEVRPGSRGGLPPRALRCVCEYIEAHLQENISLQVLADWLMFAGVYVRFFWESFRRSP